MNQRLHAAEAALLQASRDLARLANDQADLQARSEALKAQSEALWSTINQAYPPIRAAETAMAGAQAEHAAAIREAEDEAEEEALCFLCCRAISGPFEQSADGIHRYHPECYREVTAPQ